MDALVKDLRYAVRGIRRAPAFSVIAIGCLAIGIAVNAAAFSVIDAFLVRDMPGVDRQKEINSVLISYESKWGRTSPAHVSTIEWAMARGHMPAFSSSAVVGNASVALRVGGEARAVRADFVSGGFFAVLRTQPALGRLLSDDDDRAGAPLAVVISHNYWQNEFGGRDSAIGAPLFIGGTAFTIVGVAPKGFVGLYPGEFGTDLEHGAPFAFVPVAAAPLVRIDSKYPYPDAALDDSWLQLIGRRATGVSVDEVQAQANALAAAITAAYPQARAKAAAFVRMPNTASDDETIAAIAIVMAVPLLILMVACANLANQLLARAVQRSREIALRLSLGASRARIVRQLLVESSLLALAAGAVGIVLARAMTDSLASFALVLPFRIPIDLRVVAFTVSLALLTAVAFGLVPALRATRLDLSHAMKDGGAAGGYKRSRLRNGLVVLQVGVSIALLALAGVFVRASRHSRVNESADNVRHVLTASVDLELLGYTPDAGRAFQARAMERLRALPGVDAVAIAPFAPAASIREQPVAIATDAADARRYEDVGFVGGDWFAVRNTRAVQGRLFTPAESKGDAVVAVVDESLANRLWSGTRALGQSLRIGEPPNATFATVIGVVPTVTTFHGERNGTAFVPAGTRYTPRSLFYVRARGDAAALRPSVRDAIRSLDDRVPVVSVETMGETLDAASIDVNMFASAASAMGAIALLLAALGLWGVLSFIVEQRRFEIGVRMALGARAGAVTWMVLRQSLVLALVGVAVGTPAAFAVASVFRSLLNGVPPMDPIAFGASTSLVVLVALVASAVPARRAAKVDPIVALRANVG